MGREACFKTEKEKDKELGASAAGLLPGLPRARFCYSFWTTCLWLW